MERDGGRDWRAGDRGGATMSRLTDAQKRQRFERALALGGNTHTVEDVVEKVRDGRAQYWQHGDGTVVTEINGFPRMKACNYWLVSGVLSDCAALQGDIDAWALDHGCSIATAMGRIGWLRLSKLPIGADWHLRGVAFWRPLVARGGYAS